MENGKLRPEKICKNEQQLGQSNGFGQSTGLDRAWVWTEHGFEAVGGLPVRSLVDEEAVRDALGIGKVVILTFLVLGFLTF